MTNEIRELPLSHRLRDFAGRVIALAMLTALGVAIARSYVGHSPGPYGVCYGSSGRSIPCEVASGK